MKLLYSGKVRNLYDFQKNMLLMEASDRLSAFNQHQCMIPNKGQYLNEMSAWWFKETEHIIKNHYLWHQGKYMMVKKTKPIKLEFIIRGYITGSLWKEYESGNRNMYGLKFEDGLIKDQQISPILTPTFKNENDDPTTEQEILDKNILTLQELSYIKTRAFELYHFGVEKSKEIGLTLIDTKYEFGKDLNGEIILIDELHTCDSSRYMTNDNHLDKQVIRDWIKSHPNQEISNEIKQRVEIIYKTYANMLTPIKIHDVNLETFLDHFNHIFDKFVCIIAGSTSDAVHVGKIVDELKKFHINYSILYGSAHKQTQKVINYIQEQDGYERKMVWITVAGRSNALSGVVAANSKYPVFACPPFKDKTDMMTNINSTLQMPSNVPVALILEPSNLSLMIQKIFNLQS